jgi:hypothetical protein
MRRLSLVRMGSGCWWLLLLLRMVVVVVVAGSRCMTARLAAWLE